MSSREPAFPARAEATLVDMRGAVEGFFLTFRCECCETHFERLRDTIAGLPFGSYECPRCDAAQILTPEVFIAAAQRLLSPWELGELSGVDDDAARIARSWHASSEMARLLCYRGVPLGPSTERELIAFITDGLLRVRGGRGAGP